MEETSFNSRWALAVAILRYPDLCRTVPQFPTIPSVERVYTGFPFGKVASPIHHTNAIHTIKTISRISTLAAIAKLQKIKAINAIKPINALPAITAIHALHTTTLIGPPHRRRGHAASEGQAASPVRTAAPRARSETVQYHTVPCICISLRGMHHRHATARNRFKPTL